MAQHPYRPEPEVERIIVPRGPHTMPARPRELLVAVALVIAADLTMWRSQGLAEGGTGAAIFFFVVPLLVVLAARRRRVTVRFGVVLALLATIALRCAYAANTGTVLLGLVGVFVLAITMRSRAAFLTDVMASFAVTLVTFPQRLSASLAGLRIEGRTSEKTTSERLGPVLVPLGLVAVFLGIFALANPVVGRWLTALTPTFSDMAPIRAFCWVALLVGATLLLRPAVTRTMAREAADLTDRATASSVAVARNALVALNVLFLAYNAVDATYLWAGSPPPGVSERAYAHQGTAWLTVALVLMTIVVGVLFRGAVAYDRKGKLARGLAFAWLGQGLVLALGTYRRIAIHIATSGLSSIRILGILGIALVVVGLLQVGVKLARRRSFHWLLRRQLDALVLGLLAFSVMPTHLISANVNVRRVMEHEYQALVHAEEEVVEAESAATLLPMLDHDDERIRRGIAALLLNERDSLRERAARLTWRDHEIASTHALRDLEAASDKLETVLGDVDRAAAIVPFEYIRNSAIEGEIAQSEISKVLPAQTRPEVTLRDWAPRNVRGYLPETPITFVPVDGNRLEATVKMTLWGEQGEQNTNADVVFVLVRVPPSRDWHVLEHRVTKRTPIERR